MADLEDRIHDLLTELAGIDTHDVNLRDHPAAYFAVEKFLEAQQRSTGNDQRDAERYRTLRHSLSGLAGCSHTSMPRVGTPWNYQITYTPEGLDKVLDEIIEGRQQPTNCKFAAGGASCGDPRCMS